MHSLARHGNKTWPQAKTDSYKHYDLIVVGAGISGLSAAYYFKKDRPNAEVLILDNHDDFGGHAKRNEFQVGKDMGVRKQCKNPLDTVKLSKTY